MDFPLAAGLDILVVFHTVLTRCLDPGFHSVLMSSGEAGFPPELCCQSFGVCRPKQSSLDIQVMDLPFFPNMVSQ